MSVNLSNNDILLLISLVFVTFFNSLLAILSNNFTDIYNDEAIKTSIVINFLNIFATLANAYQLFISIYFLLIKSVSSNFYKLLFVLLLIKSVFFFFSSEDTFKALRLKKETIAKLRKIEEYDYAASTILFFILTVWALKSIYL
jgi:hypothetical protein